MKGKFITPVSMKVTLEQYMTDLIEPLKELGYTENINYHDEYLSNTSKFSSVDGELGFYEKNIATSGSYFIDHYNPKLFLALAAMTDNHNGNKGEWWYCYVGNNDSTQFTKGGLYKQITNSAKGHFYLKDNSNRVNGYGTGNHYHFRKATRKELIKCFGRPNQKTMKRTFPFPISRAQAQSLIDVACKDWKEELAATYGWGVAMAMRRQIKVSEQLYGRMRAAALEEHHELLDDIFGKDIKCNFEEGDYVYDEKFNTTLCVERISDIMVSMRVVPLVFTPLGEYTTMSVTISKANETLKPWNIKYAKKGQPVFTSVRGDGKSPYILRYADGSGNFYTYSNKGGHLGSAHLMTNKGEIVPFDPWNLPSSNNIF